MKEISLLYPVKVDGVDYGRLSMRSPRVRDMLASGKASSNDEEREIILFANLCEVRRTVIEELELVDYAALQDGYRSFLSTAPRTPGGPAS